MSTVRLRTDPPIRIRPPKIVVAHAVNLRRRYDLSLRQVQQLLADRGAPVSHEAIRTWAKKIEPEFRDWTQQPIDLEAPWGLKEELVWAAPHYMHLWCARTGDGVLLDLVLQLHARPALARRHLREMIAQQARLAEGSQR